MKSHRVMLAAVIVSAAVASSAYAHHSHPYFYDQCRTVTIEGRVERVEWKNPHTWITLELDDRMVYTIDWISLDALMRDGVLGAAQAAVVPGARIAVTGNPIRPTAQIREHFPDFKNEVNPRTIDPRSIRRVADTWSWGMRQTAPPSDCKDR